MTKENVRPIQGTMQQIMTDDPDFFKGIVERVLQQTLDMEMSAHIGALPYERSASRKGHRNGYKPRTLRTRVGTLNLLVPQDREGIFSTSLFSRYQRNEKALVLTLMQMYIQGVSTRKVTEITETLCGTSFSKSMVSSLSGRLDAELSSWMSRPLTGKSYPYIAVDARYENVRVGERVISQGVLIVSGVRDDGKREILSVEVDDTESESTYNELFSRLKERGLSGVKLITSDDHQGLKNAIKRNFQGSSRQRCQVHYSRNLTGLVSRSKRKELASGLKEVFAATDIKQARKAAGDLADTWRITHPKVSAHIEEHIEDCFSVLSFPLSHRQRIRTTNGLERLNQELKRRTAVVRIFPNRESCLRLVTALCLEQSEEWITGKKYLDMDELNDRSETRAKEELELAIVK